MPKNSEQRRRIEHRKRFLKLQPTKPNMILPGMVVSFMYKSTRRFDKRPCILFLWLDKKNSDKELLHGINLNYLNIQQIELLFQLLQKRTTVGLEDESKFLREEYLRVGIKGRRGPKGVMAKGLYKTIIKPKFMKKFDIYRTYDIKKVKGLRVINFELKFLEKQREEEEKNKKEEEERNKQTKERASDDKKEAFSDEKREEKKEPPKGGAPDDMKTEKGD